MFIERKYISKKIPGSADKQDNQDAIWYLNFKNNIVIKNH
jgi:hypothetical protein